jgi:hypothetical protein
MGFALPSSIHIESRPFPKGFSVSFNKFFNLISKQILLISFRKVIEIS